MYNSALLACLLPASCARICSVEPATVAVQGGEVVFAGSRIPCYKAEDFREAARLTALAIYAPEFEQRLAYYMEHTMGEGPHVAAWKGVMAKEVVAKMRSHVNGTYVRTYGGAVGLWKYWVYGNLAYDGSESGPILINRTGLKKRSSVSLSNTMAHEIAHRIGLTHPHSDDDLEIAYKEPPYVIGDIIEEIAGQFRNGSTVGQ